MATPLAHIPVPPNNSEPPSGLLEAVKALNHPEVVSAGLTTTASGEWAAMVSVRVGTRTPIPDVDRQVAGFPVIYQIAPNEPPMARPEFPNRND